MTRAYVPGGVLRFTDALRASLLALGLSGLMLGGFPAYFAEAAPHSCVCPMDADGHCGCIACNVLEIHGPRRAMDRPLGPTLTGCSSRERGVASPPSSEPATPAPELAEVAPPTRVEHVPPAIAAPRQGPDRPRLERPPRRG